MHTNICLHKYMDLLSDAYIRASYWYRKKQAGKYTKEEKIKNANRFLVSKMSIENKQNKKTKSLSGNRKLIKNLLRR